MKLRASPLGLLLALAAGCGSTGGARVLLEVTAKDQVEMYDLFVRDDTAHAVLLHTGWSEARKPGRDITTTPLRIGLTLPQSGPYSIGVVGAIGPTSNMRPLLGPSARQFYSAQKIVAGGSANVALVLLEVPRSDDVDGDLFPDATSWPKHEAAAAALPVELLDCTDSDYELYPFAKEVCGNGADDDCDGVDTPCDDADGDGDPDSTDCAPMDPKRHHPSKLDPAPESANCCGYAIGKTGDDKLKPFSGDPACHAGTCGDMIDQDCDGADKVCRNDQDCDDFPAGDKMMGCNAPPDSPPGTDCNDCDGSVNPLAAEICGDMKDNNCNGAVDETCVSCDLDGDGYQRMDAASNCPDAVYKGSMKPLDCNDEDAGVFPGSTMVPVAVPNQNKATCQGMEGGTVACALRGACRNKKPDGSQQDADCDGMPAKGCPMANDADGDGYATPADCDDMDPATFPGAPDKCGDGKAQNCVQDSPCGTDGDMDGYDDTTDCSDNDPMVHPWATELCNGRDDDCDGLVDEGNPDGTGKPMVANGQVLHCTDSGIGECAKGMPGDCVCSASSVKLLNFDQASRMACPGETADVDVGARSSATAPRCYFAAQPKPDVCDALDNDCSGATSDGKDECPGPKPTMCCPGVGMCIDLQTNANHCGACGTKCPAPNNASGSCVNGVCGVGACNPGFADCDMMPGNGCEVAITDVNNCGACGKQCVNPANGTAGCSNGMCVLAGCNAGFANCDNNGGNGCEVNVALDTANCGMCGKMCMLANSVQKCAMSMCGIQSCNAGFADCDMMVTTGCEAPISSDVNRCGGCNTKCGTPANGTAKCTNGVCGATCNAGFGDCNGMANDGCEANTNTDLKNCGMCARDCSNPNIGNSCTNGSCMCGGGGACTNNNRCTGGGGNCQNTTKCRRPNNSGCNSDDDCISCDCGGNGPHCR